MLSILFRTIIAWSRTSSYVCSEQKKNSRSTHLCLRESYYPSLQQQLTGDIGAEFLCHHLANVVGERLRVFLFLFVRFCAKCQTSRSSQTHTSYKLAAYRTAQESRILRTATPNAWSRYEVRFDIQRTHVHKLTEIAPHLSKYRRHYSRTLHLLGMV